MTAWVLPRAGVALAHPVRFVALGDSITVGLGDGITMGSRGAAGGACGALDRRGWAARLAPCLGEAGSPQTAYANLATTGARMRDVRTAQLPTALALRPHVASVIAGLNDVIREGFDAGAVTADLAECVHALRASGALVLLVRLHDPSALLRVPRSLRRTVLARVAVLNDAVEALGSGDSGVLALDLAADPRSYELTTWDVDRVHPGPRGHALLAQGFATMLTSRGLPLRRAPDLPAPRRPRKGAHTWWLLTRGLPWLVLRSHGVRGALGRLLRGVGSEPRARGRDVTRRDQAVVEPNARTSTELSTGSSSTGRVDSGWLTNL